MVRARSFRDLPQFWRYYQAGMINAAVGFGLYVVFVRMGLNKYVAQIVAHVMGVIFNYFNYVLHVFHNSAPAKARFVVAYAVNYFVGLAALLGVSLFVGSPYLGGAIALVIASVVNYVVLKYAVFVRRVS